MALSADIKTILTANSDVTAAFSTRIYPVVAPEKPTLPCIVYTLTSLTPNESKSYANKWDECYVSISAIADTFDGVEAYANYIRTAMNRYQGTISSDIIKGVNLEGQDWGYEDIRTEQGESTGIGVYVIRSNFKIMVSQNIAE